MRDHLRAYRAIQREGDHYTLNLPPNETVNRCSIDYQLTLQLTKCGLSIVIEQAFVLRTQTRSVTLDLDPPEKLAPVLALVRKRVDAITVLESGTLEVKFPGYAITVPPQETYESWQIAGPAGVVAVCLAGGELAVWSPAQ